MFLNINLINLEILFHPKILFILKKILFPMEIILKLIMNSIILFLKVLLKIIKEMVLVPNMIQIQVKEYLKEIIKTDIAMEKVKHILIIY